MDKAIQIQHDEDWENSLIAAQKAGFRHVSMGFGSSKVFHADGWEAEIARIKARLDALGLLCVQTHMPYYDLRISSEIKDAAMEKALLRSIKAAALLGARFCACHPRSAFDHDFSVRLALKDNTEAIRTLLPTAEENGVIIALENLPIFPWNTKWRFYPWNAEDLCTLADNLDSKQIGICWDFGHGFLTGLDQVRALRTVGSRLVCTHIHNNFENDDHHLPPFIGKMDFAPLMPVLREIGYQGPLTLEVNYQNDSTKPAFFAYNYECLLGLERMMDAPSATQNA